MTNWGDPVKKWDPNSTTGGTPPPLHTGQNEPPPKVPDYSHSGKGSQSVHTPALDAFAGNMESLLTMVDTAHQKLTGMTRVKAGSFYDAYHIRASSTGANNDGGLTKTYLDILTTLGKGLKDVSDGMRTLSKKYESAEDFSKLTTEKFLDAMGNADYDFGQITGSGSGSGTGSSSGNGSNSGTGSNSGNGSKTGNNS
ncbi:hypothetical protein [Streptomyces sp. NPDC093970]|uniref:hypothetical protein n=1 Tax=Streptomyces sp. NPDC093970 TaxID=3155076 RepID=UPI0034126C63